MLWLHIASVLFSARLAFRLSCPSVAEVTTESGGKVEWMSLWHDRASLARYERQVVHTAGAGTVKKTSCSRDVPREVRKGLVTLRCHVPKVKSVGNLTKVRNSCPVENLKVFQVRSFTTATEAGPS